ncbi:DUF3472 domain-containing protein [Carboxylicivirga mesophila]|uniref:DUF3472 domain-containing protein n=1 Tax=Carboxylicivirga mesophila TaxID=1166478 RepID=A0ABS5K9D0_9BACT|nr:DUF3472 domain-containing protein [Carboxylicivirga mesophila]MBS2211126.1 DUF3472 domain-containing protein [Carboxylicivirga mesophila]
MKTICSFILILLAVVFLSCNGSNTKQKVKTGEVPVMGVRVPAGGNTWVVDNPFNGSNVIGEDGIKSWDNQSDKFRIYFKLPKAGELHVGLNAKTGGGLSVIKCSVNGISKETKVQSDALTTHFVGTFSIDEPGYHFVELEGVAREAGIFAEIKDVLLGGEATVGKMYFVNEEYYWGRRGPSVHLSYKVPEAASDIEYFYNEITVPEGEDVIGSYYMANGFGEGYFGIQVNSETERRVLFSVWSPYHTDDPSSIPDDEKIILVRKGEGVTTGEFGNEGSGGQSYLKYNWITGNTYQFLLKGQPLNDGYTQYSAWFKGPELDDWRLIASFKRPKTQTWLTHQYSFLENFHTETGAISRKALYNNQWVRDTKGDWYEMTEAKFTADATARKESRMDYAGGVEDGIFFMQNCGFFNETTPIDSYHQRDALGVQPAIDFDKLP